MFDKSTLLRAVSFLLFHVTFMHNQIFDLKNQLTNWPCDQLIDWINIVHEIGDKFVSDWKQNMLYTKS